MQTRLLAGVGRADDGRILAVYSVIPYLHFSGFGTTAVTYHIVDVSDDVARTNMTFLAGKTPLLYEAGQEARHNHERILT